MTLGLDAGGTTEHPLYLGNLDWQGIKFTANRMVPVPASLTAKFTLWREGFTLEQGVLSAGRSHLDAQAEMSNFAKPRWSFRYRGWVELIDFRETFRSPLMPTGQVDLRGEGTSRTTSTRARELCRARHPPPYDIFHAAGLTSRGSYNINNEGLVVPDFLAEAFGGKVTGKVTLLFAGVQFRAETHIQNADLAGIFSAIEHPRFPIEELEWDSLMSGDTIETWNNAFQHFELGGKMDWTPGGYRGGPPTCYRKLADTLPLRFHYLPSAQANSKRRHQKVPLRGASTAEFHARRAV